MRQYKEYTSALILSWSWKRWYISEWARPIMQVPLFYSLRFSSSDVARPQLCLQNFNMIYYVWSSINYLWGACILNNNELSRTKYSYYVWLITNRGLHCIITVMTIIELTSSIPLAQLKKESNSHPECSICSALLMLW